MPFALPPDDLQRMIATERAFAARCAQVGLRDSFIEYFAPDGLLFVPRATNARAHLRRLPKAPRNALLQREPVRAEISTAGDLGFSTGPVYVTDLETKKKARTGSFFSIWRRQGNGQYRVLLDLGTGSPPSPPHRVPFYRALVPDHIPAPTAEAEIAFKAQADRAGFTQALKQSLAPDAWIFRRDSAPLYVAAAQSRLAKAPLATAWNIDASYLAQSRDLLVTRGRYELATDAGSERGNFIRVWRHQREGWRLVMDLLAPYPG